MKTNRIVVGLVGTLLMAASASFAIDGTPRKTTASLAFALNDAAWGIVAPETLVDDKTGENLGFPPFANVFTTNKKTAKKLGLLDTTKLYSCGIEISSQHYAKNTSGTNSYVLFNLKKCVELP